MKERSWIGTYKYKLHIDETESDEEDTEPSGVTWVVLQDHSQMLNRIPDDFPVNRFRAGSDNDTD
jgi:hypothetical protein